MSSCDMSAHAAIAHAKNTESSCFLVTHKSCPSKQRVEERPGQGGEEQVNALDVQLVIDGGVGGDYIKIMPHI